MSNPKGIISRLSHDGRGITHIEGKTVFVEGALPDEEIEFTYVKRRARFDEAKVATVISPAGGRLVPSCSSFGVCGGCSLQHMDSQTQLAYKQSVLLEQLAHIGQVEPKEVLPAIHGPSYGYRRKARLGVKYVHKKQRLLVGFREKNGRYLAEIDTCQVLAPIIGQQIPKISQFLMSLVQYAAIPQLEVAVGDNGLALIIRHLSPFASGDITKIKAFGEENCFDIYLQPGGNETVALLYPEGKKERLAYQLSDYGIEILFHPTDFIQVNADINQQLIRQAIELLQPDQNEQLLDLFCGIGNFTLPLAHYSKSVLGIEVNDAMVARGYENAKHNAIKNVEFKSLNLADSHYNYNCQIGNQFDAVLLDPPRTGAWEVIQALPHTLASRIVYVSCNPATLARDAGYLCTQGFELERVGVLDMFPHTSHVESIALFKRRLDLYAQTIQACLHRYRRYTYRKLVAESRS